LQVSEPSSAVSTKPLQAAPKKVLVTSLPTFRPTDKNILTCLLEHVSNGSRAKEFLWTISQEQGSNAS
jgi:hypothetical protein